MVNLKLLNKNNELIISVNYDKEVTKINPSCYFEDSLSDFNVSELGKELKIEEEQDIKYIFVNLEEKNQKFLFEKIKSKTEILLFGSELK